MRLTAKVLNEEEMKRIHNDSVRILEEVGVKVPGEMALSKLEEKGAVVDWDTKIVKMNRSMIDTAIAAAPREFILGARNQKFDVHLGPDGAWTEDMRGPFLNMDGCGSHVIDFNTGERRLGLLRDLRDIGKVFDAIPEAQVLWSAIMPDDVPPDAAGVVSSGTSMLACGKHMQDEVQNIREWKYLLEICKAFVGDEQAVKDRKIYGGTYCTVAPLTHDEEMLEGTIEMSRYHGPILIYPMPCNGTTGPASLYSNVALGNAEALSALTIFQLFNPGCPCIYGAALGRMNVRTGLFAEGAVETMLQMAAMTCMGKYYGLPTEMAGCLSDANAMNEEAVMEKVFTTLPLLQHGVDILQGIGLFEGSMTMTLEQMLVDTEIFRQSMRVIQGIEVSDAKDYFEDIRQVGPGGAFLRCKNSRKAFRTSEFYQPEMVSWQAHDRWVKDGSKGMYDLAHEKVAQILADDPVSPVDANTEKVILEILEEAAAEL